MKEGLENPFKGGEGTRRGERGTIKRSYSIRCVFKFDRKEKKLNGRRIKRNNGRGKATFSVDKNAATMAITIQTKNRETRKR